MMARKESASFGARSEIAAGHHRFAVGRRKDRKRRVLETQTPFPIFVTFDLVFSFGWLESDGKGVCMILYVLVFWSLRPGVHSFGAGECKNRKHTTNSVLRCPKWEGEKMQNRSNSCFCLRRVHPLTAARQQLKEIEKSVLRASDRQAENIADAVDTNQKVKHIKWHFFKYFIPNSPFIIWWKKCDAADTWRPQWNFLGACNARKTSEICTDIDARLSGQVA